MGTDEWKELFNGRDLTGWKAQSQDGANEWQASREVALHPEEAKQFDIQPGARRTF